MAGYNNYMSGSGRGYSVSDDWNKASYGGGSEYNSDQHVCRPVIVDAQGRRRSIISYTSTTPNLQSSESYVTASRTVEHVRAPVVVAEYKYSSQAKVEPPKDYGIWRMPLNRPQVVEPMEEYEYSSPTTEMYGGGGGGGGVTNDKWRRPSPGPVRDRPTEVEDFITKVQTEVVSQPTRPGILSATNWRNTPNSTTQGGYGEYNNNNNNNDWNKPSRVTNSIGDDDNNNNRDYYRSRNDSFTEPAAVTNKDGWERPGRNGWNMSSSSQDITSPPPLSGPTNDIGKAVEILKEAVKYSSPVVTAAASASPRPRFTVVPKSNTTYPETIDSREAAKRYGNFNLSSARPFQAAGTGDTYTGTINSREAAQKYKGTNV